MNISGITRMPLVVFSQFQHKKVYYLFDL